MKRILSFLLCIILLKAQAFAIHGPLDGVDSAGTLIVGTYSGTLTPTAADQGTRVFDFQTGEQTGTLNSVGLFTVAMPDAGIGAGTFLIFTDGISYSGTITAVGDPTVGSISGILEATYTYVDFVRDANGDVVLQVAANGAISPVTQTFQAAVRGTLSATVISSVASITAANASSGNFGRISGKADTASLFVGPNGAGELVTDKIVTYTVDGVKQSLSATNASALTAGANTAGTNASLLSLLFGGF